MKTNANGQKYLEMADLVTARLAVSDRDAFPSDWTAEHIRGARAVIDSLIFGLATEETDVSPQLTAGVLARVGQGICSRPANAETGDMSEYDEGACNMLLVLCEMLA